MARGSSIVPGSFAQQALTTVSEWEKQAAAVFCKRRTVAECKTGDQGDGDEVPGTKANGVTKVGPLGASRPYTNEAHSSSTLVRAVANYNG